MNISKEKRFQNLSEDFYYVKCAYPDFDVFQGKIGEVVKKYIPENFTKNIAIIDIGCGYGATSEIILNTRDDIKLSAVDNESQMVEGAKRYLSKWVNTRKLEIIEEDALDFLKSQEKESIDIIASVLTLHNFKKEYRDALLFEVERVLKSKGIFVNADKYALDDPEEHNKSLHSEIERFFDTFAKLKKYEVLKEWVLHHIEDQSPIRIMNERVAIGQLRKLKFQNVDITYRNFMIAVLVAQK